MKQQEIILDMGRAAFFVLALKVMASSSSLIPWNPLLDNLCILFAVCVMLVKLYTLTLPLHKLIGLGAASLLVLYSCVRIGQYDLMVTLIAVILLIDEDIEGYIALLFRTESLVLAAHIAVALILSLSGSGEVYWRMTGSRLRFDGGFGHANVLSCYITSCMLMYAWIHFKRLTRNQWAWMAAVTVLSYVMSRSRTGLLLNILLLVVVYLAQQEEPLLEKGISRSLLLLFPALSLLVFLATKQYLNGSSWAVLLDDVLTGRIKYAAYAFVRSGTTWLPRYLDYAEMGVVVWTPEWGLNSFTFDNVYSFMFMQLGMVWIILTAVLIAAVSRKASFKVKVFLLVWVLFGMVEVHGLNCFRFFPLLLLSTLLSTEEAPDEPDSAD